MNKIIFCSTVNHCIPCIYGCVGSNEFCRGGIQYVQRFQENKKILVAYFPSPGNTREIANQIHKIVGGDIFEIQSVKPYPTDHDAAVTQARQELDSGDMPALKTKVENIKSYDLIFIGYPNWCSTIPAPVKTFLSEYDLSGKTIVPFCTYGGSGLGRSVSDISTLLPKINLVG